MASMRIPAPQGGSKALQISVWRGPESNWGHHDFQSWIRVQTPGKAADLRRRSPCKPRLSRTMACFRLHRSSPGSWTPGGRRESLTIQARGATPMKCGGAGDIHASRSSDHGCYSQQSSSQTAAGMSPGAAQQPSPRQVWAPSLTATLAIASVASGRATTSRTLHCQPARGRPRRPGKRRSDSGSPRRAWPTIRAAPRAAASRSRGTAYRRGWPR
jgi:hypothetical protein